MDINIDRAGLFELELSAGQDIFFMCDREQVASYKVTKPITIGVSIRCKHDWADFAETLMRYQWVKATGDNWGDSAACIDCQRSEDS